MSFPESQRVVYGKNPLGEVVCQLRFPTILRIGTDTPAGFQDAVRAEYPMYKLQEPHVALPPNAPKELSSILEQLSLLKPPGQVMHRFSTKDSQRFISLCQDFLALTESAYTRWERFREQLRKAEGALTGTYEPAFYTRVGLRYIDRISRQDLGLEGFPWRELIRQPIIGELGALEVADDVATVQTRCVITIPEVRGGKVRLIHGLETLAEDDGEEGYIIDADFFVEGKEGLDEPFEILDKFNGVAGRLFRWAITPTLHRAMEPRAI